VAKLFLIVIIHCEKSILAPQNSKKIDSMVFNTTFAARDQKWSNGRSKFLKLDYE
jgi:hypothetical protein